MSELNYTLTAQLFEYREEDDRLLNEVCRQAEAYAALDGSIVVVSDFRYGHCYIYAGKFGKQFGLAQTADRLSAYQVSQAKCTAYQQTADRLSAYRHQPQAATSLSTAYQVTAFVDTGSAFEDCLFSKFHPDDERERQALELSYLRMMQTIPIEEHLHYNTSCIIRIQNTSGEWRQVHYRVLYRASHRNGSVWLAVCFYSPAIGTRSSSPAIIINNQSGEIIPREQPTLNLTKREKQILALISEGLLSKQIADRLCISEHTVNRHRQNIIERLGVSNTAQALHAAHLIGLI